MTIVAEMTIQRREDSLDPASMRLEAAQLLAAADELELELLQADGRRIWTIDWENSFSKHDGHFFLGLQKSTLLGERYFMRPATPENETQFGVGSTWADGGFSQEMLAVVEVVSKSRDAAGSRVCLVAEVN